MLGGSGLKVRRERCQYHEEETNGAKQNGMDGQHLNGRGVPIGWEAQTSEHGTTCEICITYIYIYIYTHICVYIYIYTHIVCE